MSLNQSRRVQPSELTSDATMHGEQTVGVAVILDPSKAPSLQ